MAARDAAEPDHDLYVAPPAEPVPAPRLHGVQPWLWLAIVLIVGASVFLLGLETQRQDPSLDIPGSGPDELLIPTEDS